MRLSARALNRATLARQLLLRREPVRVEDAVGRVLAVQAQQNASPYLALWNRVADLDPADVDDAFVHGTVVKATLVRVTLHAVRREDHAVLHQAMQPTLRGARLADPRFTSAGVPVAEVDALLPDLLAHASSPRTAGELEAWLGERLGVPAAGVWWAVRSVAPLRHAPTGGPWSFGQRPAYVAAGPGPTPADAGTAHSALVVLVRRYLAAFGPATLADVAQFALVTRTRVRAALLALGEELERCTGPAGEDLYDVPGAPLPPEETPAPPRLMAMWDSLLLAHHDRTRVLPPDLRRVVIRANGDVLPTVLVDGQVVGVWRPVDGALEVTAYRALADEDWDGLDQEAAALRAFLADRQPDVYHGYARWWARLPEPVVVRRLGR